MPPSMSKVRRRRLPLARRAGFPVASIGVTGAGASRRATGVSLRAIGTPSRASPFACAGMELGTAAISASAGNFRDWVTFTGSGTAPASWGAPPVDLISTISPPGRTIFTFPRLITAPLHGLREHRRLHKIGLHAQQGIDLRLEGGIGNAGRHLLAQLVAPGM